MSKEQIQERIAKLGRARFLLAMKDFWSRADFAEDDKMEKEIRELEKKLEKI